MKTEREREREKRLLADALKSPMNGSSGLRGRPLLAKCTHSMLTGGNKLDEQVFRCQLLASRRAPRFQNFRHADSLCCLFEATSIHQSQRWKDEGPSCSTWPSISQCFRRGGAQQAPNYNVHPATLQTHAYYPRVSTMFLWKS